MAFSSRSIGIGFSCFRGNYGSPIFVFILFRRLLPSHVLVENRSMAAWPLGVLIPCGCLSMYSVTMLDGVGWLPNIPIEY
ncbi:hypothetical protein BJX96DRAFT_74915 [Aspergillus floccosus]